MRNITLTLISRVLVPYGRTPWYPDTAAVSRVGEDRMTEKWSRGKVVKGYSVLYYT